MTGNERLAALNQIDLIVSTDPTMANTVAAEGLLELLNSNPDADSFWNAFLSVVTPDNPLRLEVESGIGRSSRV
jgi:hypothetical protein